MKSFFFGSLLLTSIAAVSSGCGSGLKDGGPDADFLADTTATDAAKTTVQGALLPLKTGNTWKMNAFTPGGQRAVEQLTLVGPQQAAGQTGTLLEIRRGKSLWRREVYQADSKQLRQIAMGEGSQPLMTLSPPVPLVDYPLVEGATKSWRGTFQFKGKPYPASGYSRVSAREDVKTPAGRFVTYRVDTVITLYQNGQEIHFPSIRWLAPGIGYVRRGFADGGKPAFAELIKFEIK